MRMEVSRKRLTYVLILTTNYMKITIGQTLHDSTGRSDARGLEFSPKNNQIHEYIVAYLIFLFKF